MRFFLCIFSLISIQAFAAVEGQETFDKAYKEYWSKPVNNWNQIAKSRQTEVYVVRKRDTLSELSEVFFGTPNYWPKIWSLNQYIGNPHLIYPGNKLGFYVGSVEGPAPQIFLGLNKDLIKTTNSIYSLDDLEVKIPPDPVVKDVLEKIPESFPEWKMSSLESTDVFGGEEVEKQFSKLSSNVMKFSLTSFLHQGDLKTYGEVKAFANVDNSSGSVFDEIYINPHEPLPLGTVFTLVMPKRNAKTPEGKTIKDVKIYEYVGEVTIIGDETPKTGLVSGRISKSYDMVDAGALLISGRVPQYDLGFNPDNIQPVDAHILRGSELFGFDVMGVGQTVFVSQGEKQGITAGSLIEVKQNREARVTFTKTPTDIVNKIGVIKIISSTPDVSTGIVVSSRDFIAPGDKSIE